MLFHSSIRQELARSFGATLVVLATVVMTMTLIRTLGQASRGTFNPSDVMLIMGYTVLAYMPTILTMSLFISIFGTMSRMYRDSEMVIWFTSGRGLAALLKPLFRFAWPVLLVIMALALLVLPWSNQKIEHMKQQYEKRGDIERVEPGQFQESMGGKRVFFVEKDASSKQSGSNVFIATTENGKETITSARSGRIQRTEQGRFLMLSNGQRLESAIAGNDLKISEFEEYGIKVDAEVLPSGDFVQVNTLPTLELLQNRSLQALAELSWRIGLILAAMNFVIIGVAVSSANPRVRRSANLVFSLFAFVLYNNLLNLGQNWIATGRFTFGGFLLTLHGGALLIGLVWLAKGHNNWDWQTLSSLIRPHPRKTPS
ncbi:MAG: LPS export ABC transporter permease LptF [Rhodoferax sp.]